MRIPITKTVFGECEKENIAKPLETGWVVQGPYVAKFQEMFAEFTGSAHAHATTSCTTALHLGLEALGIGRGDKVIVPSFTYVASANSVEYAGAEAVFCDIDLRTFNIDVRQLDELLRNDPAIRAVMPVNLFGLCANLPEIEKIVDKYQQRYQQKIFIIEDSACGFDGWIGDRHSGTFGDVGCFSFHPRKSICTGEGGMLITDDDTIATRISQLKDHGASKSDLERHKEKGGSLLPDFTMRGYNYRMTDMQGALGVCQMKKADYIMSGRRRVAAKYDEVLGTVTVVSDSDRETVESDRVTVESDRVTVESDSDRGVETVVSDSGQRGRKLSEFLIPPFVPEGYRHGYQSYVCLFTGGEDLSDLFASTNTNTLKSKIDRINVKRNLFMEKLEERGIATRQGTHAVHTLEYYKKKNGFNDEDFLMSYAADRLSVALPLYAEMTDEEFGYVIQNIVECLSDSGQ